MRDITYLCYVLGAAWVQHAMQPYEIVLHDRVGAKCVVTTVIVYDTVFWKTLDLGSCVVHDVIHVSRAVT